MSIPRKISRATGLLLAVAMLAFTGCDSSTVNDSEQSTDLTQSSADATSSVVADLGLSADQQAQVTAFINGNQAGVKEAGFSWRLAAQLQSTLTAEQKARLLEQASDRSGDRRFGSHRNVDGQFRSVPSGMRHRGAGGLGSHGPGGGLGDILTDEQKEAVHAIRESYRDQLEAIHNQVSSGEITWEQARDLVDEIHAAIRSEIDALLTEEQRTQLEERRAAREAERTARHEEAKLVRDEVLGLDADGSAALDAILDEFREGAEALREEMRDAEADRDQVHAALQSLKESRDAQVAALLDSAGFEVFQIHEALRHRLRGHRMRPGGVHNGRFGQAPHGGAGENGSFGNRG